MIHTRFLRTRLAAAALAATGAFAAAPAHAETFALGVISASSVFDIGNDGLKNWFNDVYTFTVASGSNVSLSGHVSNVYGRNVDGAANLWSDLYVGAGQFVRFAVGSTAPVGDSGFLFEKTATYNPLNLAPGTYGLYVQGLVTAGGFAPVGTTSYTGQLAFNVSPPVPEPAALALLAGGLGLVGWTASRKAKAKRDSAAA